MLAKPSESPACSDTVRQRRLAAQLADMIPGAATIRVSLDDPKQTWPHPHAIAKDTAGQPVELSRTTSKIAARWILRGWPDADWAWAHTFDLATATLTCNNRIVAGGR
jgi:hypothetical protein